MSSRPLTIGIAGGSASGKSHLTGLLERSLADRRVRSIHMDAYFKREKPVWTSPFTGEPVEDHNHPACFDLDRLYADVDAARTDAGTDVLLVEGLLILHDPRLREGLDLRVYVDCRVEERLYRRIKRNMAWKQSMDQTADFYLASVRYRHDELIEPSRWHADVVVNGSTRMGQGAELIKAWVETRVGLRAPRSNG